MTSFVLDPRIMRTWSLDLWVAFTFLVATLGALFWRISVDYTEAGVIKYYLIYGLALIVFLFFYNIYKLNSGHYLHIHHYAIALVLITFLSNQSVFQSLV
jgi:hypothetical protein